MAVISPSNCTKLYQDTAGETVVLYRVKGVSSGDTIEVGTGGMADFRKIKCAAFCPSGSTVTTAVVATFATTNITLTLASMSNDDVNLLVVGTLA